MVGATRLAIMGSGNGTGFSAIMNYIDQKQLAIQIVLLVVDHDDAPIIKRAETLNIPVFIVNYHDSRRTVEQHIIDQLKEKQVSGVILDGYMRILSPEFVRNYPKKIINIHPALLPSFPGRHGIKDAFDYGVKITGVTIHYVDDGVDSGEIIDQVAVPIETTDTLASLEGKIHIAEHQLYPKTIQTLVEKGVFKKHEKSTD